MLRTAIRVNFYLTLQSTSCAQWHAYTCRHFFSLHVDTRAKRLAGKNVSEITCCVSSWTLNLNSINRASGWRQFGVAVTTIQLSYLTSGPVSTGMGDRLRVGIYNTSVFNQPPRLTRPPTFSANGNECRQKGRQNALRMHRRVHVHSTCG